MSRTVRRKDSFGRQKWKKWDKKRWTCPTLGVSERKAEALYFSDSGVKVSCAGPAPKKYRKDYVRSLRHKENQKLYEAVSKGKIDKVLLDGKHRHSATWYC